MPGEVRRIKATLPDWAAPLFTPHRYKVLYGGRGGGKSWTVAQVLLLLAAKSKLRVMCAREIQRSLKESVYQLLCDQITRLGLDSVYTPLATEIRGVNGSRFFFSGLRQLTADQIKSYEDVDICWVEEAHVVSKKSWDVLLPTIRKEDSEVWITFNPDSESDPVYTRFILDHPPGMFSQLVNYDLNPWFPDTLERERQYWELQYPETYNNIWLGVPRAAVLGAFYHDELRRAEEEERVTHVPVLSEEVHTAWDLGMSDATAIWFFQTAGQEIHFVDYYEAAGVGLEHYVKVLQRKDYVYGRHFAPHDIQVRELGTGLSRMDRAKQLGVKFTVLPTNRMRVEDGIEIVRSQFSKIWIDKSRCERGLLALRNYRAELANEGTEIVYNKPRHDWASHAADAFRYACIGLTKTFRAGRLTPEEIRQMYEDYGPPRTGGNYAD